MYPRTYSSEWDFKNVNTKEYTHGYHNYPAMMIPQIARKLLNEYRPEGHFGCCSIPTWARALMNASAHPKSRA